MKKNRFKQHLTIQIIGKQKFWIGIIAGIISTICLYLFFDYSREILRFIDFFSRDLKIKSADEIYFFNYFFAAFSVVIGFGFTMWILFSGSQKIRNNTRLRRRLSQTNSLVAIWVFFMVVARAGSLLPILFNSGFGYDDSLNFYDNYWIIFVLIPILLFFQHWNIISLVYKTYKWILFTFIIISIISFVLGSVNFVDKQFFNDIFYQSNTEEFSFIDKEIKFAKKNGIFYSEETKNTLSQYASLSSFKQIEEVQKAFFKPQKVPLDTLILQKVIIHNFKKKVTNYYYYDKDRNWQYAYPEQILKQIKMYKNTNCTEVQLLFEIVHEMVLPLKTKEIDWSNSEQYSKYEKRKYFQKRYMNTTTETIIGRLIELCDNLKNDTNYVKYHYLIPELDSTDIERR